MMATIPDSSLADRTCNRCPSTSPEYYVRDGTHLCGHCMDREDDSRMPALTSEVEDR